MKSLSIVLLFLFACLGAARISLVVAVSDLAMSCYSAGYKVSPNLYNIRPGDMSNVAGKQVQSTCESVTPALKSIAAGR